MTEKKEKVYFPGLNGLRFFAASAVIITHVELLKGQVGHPNLWDEKAHPFIYNLGGLGVYFFFVLSGFLITYLLMEEKKRLGTVGIKNFYLRRVFRIWPVYYLLAGLAFFIFPHIHVLRLDWFDRFLPQHFWLKFLLYMLLLPNLALAAFPSVPHAGQAWSIGVEEQFYLLWPWLVRKFRRLDRVLIVLCILLVVVKAIVLLVSNAYPANHALQALKAFVAMTKIECMAIGGLGAWVLHNHKLKLLDLVYSVPVQIMSYLLIPVLVFFTPDIIQNGIHIVYSVAFLVIIMNVALNPKSFLKLNGRVFDYLGNISYGMYMFHMFIVVLVIRFTYSHIPAAHPVVLQVTCYSLAFLCTIAFSSLSYYLYEKPFIRLKRRFSDIISGSEALKDSR